MAPKDEDELVDMMFTCTLQKGPTFIRYPRGTAEGVPIKETPKVVEIGKAEVTHLCDSYSQRPPGEIFALLGSTGFLEISANKGSASRLCGADKGAEVSVTLQ